MDFMACKKLLSEALLPDTPKVLSKFLKLWSRLAVVPAAAVAAGSALAAAVPFWATLALVCAISEPNSAPNLAVSAPPPWRW